MHHLVIAMHSIIFDIYVPYSFAVFFFYVLLLDIINLLKQHYIGMNVSIQFSHNFVLYLISAKFLYEHWKVHKELAVIG